jgi:hypothetical protein
MKYLIVYFLLGVLLCDVVCASFKDSDPWIQSDCVNNVKRRRSQIKADADSWKGLPWTRADLISYADRGFDTDGDKAINFTECENARNYYFTPVQIQLGETCDTVFRRCDCDGDGFITKDDFLNSYMSCLKDGKSGRLINWLIGEKITADGAFKGKNEVEDIDISETDMAG